VSTSKFCLKVQLKKNQEKLFRKLKMDHADSGVDSQDVSNKSLSPIVRRTSRHFYDKYDSISDCFSDSTVAPSDYVQRGIDKFELEQSVQNTSKQATIYNLRIDKVVIDGGKTN
jgi:hypothetical protein